MSHIITDPLLDEVTAFCEQAGVAWSAFGEAAVGDPNFVFDLKAGREPRRRVRDRVADYMATGTTWASLKGEDAA